MVSSYTAQYPALRTYNNTITFIAPQSLETNLGSAPMQELINRRVNKHFSCQQMALYISIIKTSMLHVTL